jgi:hypothetical protein
MVSTQIISVSVKNKQVVVVANIVLNTTDMVGQGLVLAEVKKSDISGVNSVLITREITNIEN